MSYLHPSDIGLSPKQPLFLRLTQNYRNFAFSRYGISHFYSFVADADAAPVLTASPDGCTDLIFCCDPDHPYAYIVGSFTTTYNFSGFQNSKNRHFFGVSFVNGKMPLFKEAAPIEIVNHSFKYQDFKLSPYLFEQIASSNDFIYQIQIFLTWYFEHFVEKKGTDANDQLAAYAIDKIRCSLGKIQLKELSEETAVSERYLNKIVLEKTGLSPKFLGKIARFQYFIDLVTSHPENAPIPYAELSIKAGYYDQSHMIRDFKSFTHMTPTQYLAIISSFDYHNKFTNITNKAIPWSLGSPTRP